MNLDHAIQKHAEWKLKFRSAMSNQETMDVATISKDNCCELGKWLHGEAKLQWARLGAYAVCVAKHAAFHVEAGKVAAAINAKKYADAEAMMGAGTRYNAASSEVGAAIVQLKKEAGL